MITKRAMSSATVSAQEPVSHPSSSSVALRLAPSFDAARLQRDLEALLQHYVALPQRGSEEALAEALGTPCVIDDPELLKTRKGWIALSLWSQGGAWDRTDCGCPGLDDFRPTEALVHAPYFREVLDGLMIPLRSVRLLRLTVGTSVRPHTDSEQSFRHGVIRLAIPVVSHPEIVYIIGGERLPWLQPGELWYTDVEQSHSLENPGPFDRLHIVIDTEIDDNVLALFPAEFVAEKERTGIMRRKRIERGVDLRPYCGSFEGPANLIPMLTRPFRGSLELYGGNLVWCIDSRPMFKLMPVGEHRFQITGAVPAATVEIDPAARLFRMAMFDKTFFQTPLELRS